MHVRIGMVISLVSLCVLMLGGCLSSPPSSGSISVQQRVEMIRTDNVPVYSAVKIHWDSHQFPFIEADDDRDVPFALGVVHAHLRAGQMLMLRRISQGRLAESIGPIGPLVEIDLAIRAINFPKAAAEIERGMRADTLAWVERYVEGLNHHRRTALQPPIEQRVLAIDDEPWTVRDIITLGRLASIDITWGAFLSYLSLHKEKGFEDYWQRTVRHAGEATPSFGAEGPVRFLASLSKSGSNSFAVAGKRTASGFPILANDPHVGFNLPALWCYVGYKSPSLHASGFTIAGIPFVVLGRNEHIAWGGTNMQGISSALVDVSGIPKDEIRSRKVTIDRRFWFSAEREIRETAFGPIISDLAPVEEPHDPPLALLWRGHDPSDEFTAFYDASRARTWDEFRKAFAPYAVSGQNMMFADRSGNIGHVLAYEFQPAAGLTALLPVSDPNNPSHRWGRGVPSTELPFGLNPASGVLVSTNNTPVRTDPPMVLAGNANDRHDRITSLIQGQTEPLDVERALRIQLDTYSAASHGLARAIVDRSRARSIDHALLNDLSRWDGRYDIDSRGALVVQTVAFHLMEKGYADRYSEKVVAAMRRSSASTTLLSQDVASGSLDGHIAGALERAARDAPDGRSWGAIHTLKVSHWFGMAPLVGGSFRFGEIPVAGSSTTVLKSAHEITNEKHATTYGANARHIMDLADLDETYVAILAGQDGWLGSANFLDQLETWRDGRLIRVPMSLPAVRAATIATTTLTPTPK